MERAEQGDERVHERGFIAIVGVVMGGLLALGVWKLVQVATTLASRERVTNAADAIAFDNAVWHAHGMNLLVYMNAAMAIVLSVFVALRVLELLLIAIAVLAAIFAPAALTAIGNGLTRVVNLERKVGPRIMKILHVVNMAERVVASVVPALPGGVNRLEAAVGLRNPNARAQIDIGSVEDYYESAGVISQGVPMSLSMIPTAIDRKIPGFPARMGQLDGQVHSSKLVKGLKLLTGNPSLPVEEEDYFQVCSRAAEFMTAGFTGMLARTGLVSDTVARLVASRVGQVVGTLPALACEPFDAASLQREVEQQVKGACKAEKEKQESGDEPKTWTRRDQRKCEKKHNEKAKENFKQPAGGPNPDMIKTAKLWNIIQEPSQNVFLHTWAAAVPQRNSFPLEGTIKGWLLFVTGDSEDADDKIVLGEAEYFYQCRPDQSRRSCSDDALWRPFWTATPIRVNAPWREFDVVGTALGWGNNAAGEILSAALKKVLVSSFRGRHAAEPDGREAGSHITMFLFGKGNGSNYATRYILPGYLQNQAETRGGALVDEYRPFVEDLLIH
jgi:hypothetical protein